MILQSNINVILEGAKVNTIMNLQNPIIIQSDEYLYDKNIGGLGGINAFST